MCVLKKGKMPNAIHKAMPKMAPVQVPMLAIQQIAVDHCHFTTPLVGAPLWPSTELALASTAGSGPSSGAKKL